MEKDYYDVIDVKKIRKCFEVNERLQENVIRNQVKNTTNFFENQAKNNACKNSAFPKTNHTSELPGEQTLQKSKSLQQLSIKKDLIHTNGYRPPHRTTPATITKNSSSSNDDSNNNNYDTNNFSHIRYQIVQTDLSKGANNVQLPQLINYLNSYSINEILQDEKKIILVEPIRSQVDFNKTKTDNNPKTTKNSKNQHKFFCQPIRINKELVESELPMPQTVKQAKNYFEEVVGTANGNWHGSGDLSPVSQMSSTESTSRMSPMPPTRLENGHYQQQTSHEYLNDLDNMQLISESIMEKIRSQGTSVTYFGGQKIDNRSEKKSFAITNRQFDYDLQKVQKKNSSRHFNEINFESYEIQ